MKIYFYKSNPENYQTFPEPDNLDDFIMLEVDDISALDNQELVAIGEDYRLVDKRPSDLHDWNGESWQINTEKATALFTHHKQALIKRLADKADSLTAQLLAGYPQTEIESFYRQEKEALAWQADNNAPVPMISQIAEQRGVPLAILVEKIIEKSNQFAALAGAIIGQRQKFETQIFAAENVENLTALEQEIEQWTN